MVFLFYTYILLNRGNDFKKYGEKILFRNNTISVVELVFVIVIDIFSSVTSALNFCVTEGPKFTANLYCICLSIEIWYT